MTAFASDLSYRVLQERRRRGELTTPQTDQGRGLPYLAVQRPVIRFWDAGEGGLVLDGGDGAQIADREPTPVGFPSMTGRGSK